MGGKANLKAALVMAVFLLGIAGPALGTEWVAGTGNVMSAQLRSVSFTEKAMQVKY